jgi:chitin synthase
VRDITSSLPEAEGIIRHDLSWGTKGSDSAQAVDLGSIQGVGKHVEVELVSAQQDIDIAYQDALDNIRLKRAIVDADEIPPKNQISEQHQKDIYVRREGALHSSRFFVLIGTPAPGKLQNKREFRDRQARTRRLTVHQLLLLWSLSNALLASVILSGGDTSSTFSGGGNSRTAIYMLIILSE